MKADQKRMMFGTIFGWTIAGLTGLLTGLLFDLPTVVLAVDMLVTGLLLCYVGDRIAERIWGEP